MIDFNGVSSSVYLYELRPNSFTSNIKTVVLLVSELPLYKLASGGVESKVFFHCSQV